MATGVAKLKLHCRLERVKVVELPYGEPVEVHVGRTVNQNDRLYFNDAPSKDAAVQLQRLIDRVCANAKPDDVLCMYFNRPNVQAIDAKHESGIWTVVAKPR